MLHVSEQLLKGNKRSLSRAISLLERGDPQGAVVTGETYSHVGNAYCVGITGPPGAGKSTLIACLIGLLRNQNLSVGVIGVDPTSPYSGGALLGDRIRMQEHYLDPGVFIRSMATRGSHGGVPRIVKGVERLLDASGKDVVLVETVGVGQTEVDVMGVADTVVVTLVPEAGDAIQTLKAGLMEIADIYVVNKADRPGADKMIAAVRSTLALGVSDDSWIPPVVATDAVNGQGLDKLWAGISEHREYISRTGKLESRRRARRSQEFFEVVEEELGRRIKERLHKDPEMRSLLNQVESGKQDPYSFALALLEDQLTGLGDTFLFNR
ncbi:methylmalonyl Co-A mutase-associated GTPase MeaB [SAR202 cluster bacterium AD-804-J14_MRT_500m]|nr:methylmalonyl Co-A mutase-associated GTPase MeaB [SAR202 cluster bacterium AD-804-J14_MRT_500m]